MRTHTKVRRPNVFVIFFGSLVVLMSACGQHLDDEMFADLKGCNKAWFCEKLWEQGSDNVYYKKIRELKLSPSKMDKLVECLQEKGVRVYDSPGAGFTGFYVFEKSGEGYVIRRLACEGYLDIQPVSLQEDGTFLFNLDDNPIQKYIFNSKEIADFLDAFGVQEDTF